LPSNRVIVSFSDDVTAAVASVHATGNISSLRISSQQHVDTCNCSTKRSFVNYCPQQKKRTEMTEQAADVMDVARIYDF